MQAIDAERTDAVLTEHTVVGAAALAMSARPHPPVVACGILPLGLSSVDTAPWGLGILPRSDAIGRIRNRFLNWAAKNIVLRAPQRQAEEMIDRLSGAELDVFFMDWPIHADHYAQFTVRGFEYPRRDLPANVSFIGPVIRASARSAELPAVVERPRSRLPVVHVSQGTVANEDLEELVLPTVRALADHHVLVVVSTGGAPVQSLGPLPANARAAEFLPYGELMPKVRVFVTNGGYGGLHFALGHGVPIVVAGDTEDKMETTRRVEWSGAGINLRTGTPTEAKIAAAVERVLSERRFRDRARALQAEIAAAPGLPSLERIVLDLVARRAWSRVRRSAGRRLLAMPRQGENPVGCLGQPVGDERVDRPVALAGGRASPRRHRRSEPAGERHPAAPAAPPRAPAGRCPRSAPGGGVRRRCRG